MSFGIAANPKSERRSYTRLSAADWDRIAQLYSSGGLTLAEIADQYGVSVRNIQIHLAKRKPSAPAHNISASNAKRRLLTCTVFTTENHAACIEDTKAAVYSDAAAIQAILREAVAELHGNTDLPATARVRACDQAAVALDRINKIRRTVLGMSKEEDVADRPLPEFVISVLTAKEERAIRDQHALEDGALGSSRPAEDSGEVDHGDDLVDESER